MFQLNRHINERKMNKNIFHSIVFLAISLLFISCDIGNKNIEDNNYNNKTQGIVEVVVPSVSSYILDSVSPDRTDINNRGAGERALLVVSKAVVELIDSTNNIVSTMEIINNDFSRTKTSFLADPGSGYKIRVQIYNYKNSETIPVVCGESEFFSVVGGQSVDVGVSCLPLDPVELEEGTFSETISLEAANSNSLASMAIFDFGEEYWLKAVPSSNLTFFKIIPVENKKQSQIYAIFNSEGHYIEMGYFLYGDSVLVDTIPGETYYIGVVDFNTYIGEDLVFPSGDFQFIYEPVPEYSDGNDSFSQVIALDVGGEELDTSIGGCRDADFYSVEMEAGKIYLINTPNEIDYFRVELSDTIDSDSYKTSGYDKTYYKASMTQTYYIKTLCENETETGTYKISVEELEPTDDGNDSFGEAIELVVDGVEKVVAVDGFDDSDYFSVLLIPGHNYSFKISYIESYYLDIELYDSSFTHQKSGWGSDILYTVSAVEGETPQRCYLRVENSGGFIGGNYTISVSDVPSYDDGNDNFAEAIALNVDGDEYLADIGGFFDFDFYKIELESGKSYKINILESNYLGIQKNLFDSEYNRLYVEWDGTFSVPLADPVMIVKYFIKLDTNGDDDLCDYSIFITEQL